MTVELQITNLGVAPVNDAGNNPDSNITYRQDVGSGVVLHLLARLIRNLAATFIIPAVAKVKLTDHPG